MKMSLNFENVRTSGNIIHFSIIETGEIAKTNPENGNIEVFDGKYWSDKYSPVEKNILDDDGELKEIEIIGYEEI